MDETRSQVIPGVRRTFKSTMHPRTFYIAIVLPILTWVGVSELLSLWLGRFAETQPMPSLPERILIAGHIWGIRAMPFAILVGVLITRCLPLSHPDG